MQGGTNYEKRTQHDYTLPWKLNVVSFFGDIRYRHFRTFAVSHKGYLFLLYY